MPSILTDELAWEWLMEKPGEERLSQIARTQIPSRLLDFCTVDRNYRTALEAKPLEYPELPPIDTSFINTEELQFNHWPLEQEQVFDKNEEMVLVGETALAYYPPRINKQGDLFS
jgi:hypothetical protein